MVCGESTFTEEKKKEISLSNKLCRYNHEQKYQQAHSTSKPLFCLLLRKNTIEGEHCKKAECHGTDQKREKGESECQSAKITEWNMHVLEQLQPH